MLAAAREFLTPLTGSSLATVIVFVPLAFLSGVTGAFFKALSSPWRRLVHLVPGDCACGADAGLPAPAVRPTTRDRRENRALRLYGAVLGRLLARHGSSWPARAAARARLGRLLACRHRVHAGMDEGGFVLDYHTPPGTSLTETDRLSAPGRGDARRTPDVATYSRRTGAGLGGDLSEPNTATSSCG